jgi:Xaa-Pro aminopeptidase
MTKLDDLVVTPTFPEMTISGRIASLRACLADAECDALLVTKLENIRYLTGFSGSAGMLFVHGKGALFVSDGRYGDQAAAQLGAAGVEAKIKIGGQKEQLRALGTAGRTSPRIGLEASACTWSQMLRFADIFSKAQLVPTSGLVEAQRVIKDAGELARIEAACDIADIALAQVKHRLTEGLSERAFAAELEFEMRCRGADGPSFETIVASGPNAAMPHARPTNRSIEHHELIVVDFGAIVDGYHSDMTRTFCVGDPEQDLGELVDAVLTSQRAGLSAVSQGVEAGHVDAACRDVLGALGYGDIFVHSTGHGVGLEIHEAPAVASKSPDILRSGTVVTVEPGAYVSGRGGARIEDTLVVTDTGGRVLTKSTKDYTL